MEFVNHMVKILRPYKMQRCVLSWLRQCVKRWVFVKYLYSWPVIQVWTLTTWILKFVWIHYFSNRGFWWTVYTVIILPYVSYTIKWSSHKKNAIRINLYSYDLNYMWMLHCNNNLNTYYTYGQPSQSVFHFTGWPSCAKERYQLSESDMHETCKKQW